MENCAPPIPALSTNKIREECQLLRNSDQDMIGES